MPNVQCYYTQKTTKRCQMKHIFSAFKKVHHQKQSFDCVTSSGTVSLDCYSVIYLITGDRCSRQYVDKDRLEAKSKI